MLSFRSILRLPHPLLWALVLGAALFLGRTERASRISGDAGQRPGKSENRVARGEPDVAPPESGDNDQALAEIARALSAHDPQRAFETAGRIAGPEARIAAVTACLREWTLADPFAAADWAARLTDSEERSRALGEVAATWASLDAIAAARFTSDSIPDEAVLEHAIPALVSQTQASERPAIRQWIDSLPGDDLKAQGLAELTRLERNLMPAPARLPGEDIERRDPVPLSALPKNQKP